MKNIFEQCACAGLLRKFIYSLNARIWNILVNFYHLYAALHKRFLLFVLCNNASLTSVLVWNRSPTNFCF